MKIYFKIISEEYDQREGKKLKKENLMCFPYANTRHLKIKSIVFNDKFKNSSDY